MIKMKEQLELADSNSEQMMDWDDDLLSLNEFELVAVREEARENNRS